MSFIGGFEGGAPPRSRPSLHPVRRRRAHPHHGPAFFELLERVMPDWDRRKEKLERLLA
jgi:hypothetical protein